MYLKKGSLQKNSGLVSNLASIKSYYQMFQFENDIKFELRTSLIGARLFLTIFTALLKKKKNQTTD